jgi:hypothetical protein
MAIEEIPNSADEEAISTPRRDDETLAPEELKAWSQNLGHESILTTFSSPSLSLWRPGKMDDARISVRSFGL